jgi:hypothetical protein
MAHSAGRVASASNWLATSAYAYSAFVASTRRATTAVHWAAALFGASVTYGLVMLFFATLWQHDIAHSAIWCAGGMAVAVLCGARVASAILLPPYRRSGVWACTGLATVYPLLLAACSAPDAPVRAMQLLYVASAAIGGFAALRMLAVRPPWSGSVNGSVWRGRIA